MFSKRKKKNINLDTYLPRLWKSCLHHIYLKHWNRQAWENIELWSHTRECGICSGSTLFITHLAVFQTHHKIVKWTYSLMSTLNIQLFDRRSKTSLNHPHVPSDLGLWLTFTATTLLANSPDDKLVIFFFFIFPRKLETICMKCKLFLTKVLEQFKNSRTRTVHKL